MKTVQNLGYKVNTKRDSKSYNDRYNLNTDKFERKANVAFKAKRARLAEEYAF